MRKKTKNKKSEEDEIIELIYKKVSPKVRPMVKDTTMRLDEIEKKMRGEKFEIEFFDDQEYRGRLGYPYTASMITESIRTRRLQILDVPLEKKG